MHTVSADSEFLERVLAAGAILVNIGDIDILLEQILTEARFFTNADAGSIYTVEGNVLSFCHSQNETIISRGERIPYTRFTIPINKSSMAGYVACTSEILNIDDVRKIPEEAPYSFDDSYDRIACYRTRSTLTLPLTNNRHVVVGVLQLINAKADQREFIPFHNSMEPLAKYYATLGALALERAMMTRTLLMRMVNMTEMRDPKETGPHVNRVGSYSVIIYDSWAKANGIDEKDRVHNRDILRMAAMLHDVGKTGISDIILKKPGNLTADERKLMEKHCSIGAEVLRNCESAFDEMARDIALNHHENWDGSGYPAGLKGKKIPFMARIAAIADVFDALSSQRAYKDPWPDNKVTEEMEKLFIGKFDPDLKVHLISQLDALREIKESYPEQ
ncbi:MAG: HD domain-containing protein [Candidatus Sabulitectum sp.]|nr:HD domain-containing protein [Candidatus Sabulitectum sp.]